MYPVAKDYRKGVLRELFPHLTETPDANSLSPKTVRQAVSAEFKAGAHADAGTSGRLLDQAIEALRIFAAQREISETCSCTLTDCVYVEVVPAFISRSTCPVHPGASRWLWSYRCQVENRRDTDVQLFGRHWIILDSDSRVSSEVPRFSQGVVGQQPVLQPGAMFEYHSMAELDTASGSMQGCFHLVTLDSHGLPNDPIDARIRAFKLTSPDAVRE